MSDFRTALRTLRKHPRFSMVAIFTIALGIAATTSLFSVYDRLVLNPITITSPSSLVAILNSNPQLRAPAASVSYPRYEFLRDHVTSFSALALSAFDTFNLTGNGDPDQLQGLRVSASFLPTLGVTPVRGRNIAPEEDVPNGPAVCLVSYELWQTKFGGRESLVGESIVLGGTSWQVVGITPPRMSVPFGQVQIFAPRVFEVGGLTAAQVQAGAGYAQPIARLKPGVSLESAREELAAISRDYKAQFGGRLDAQNTSVPQAYIDFLVSSLQPTFYTLLAAVAFVLLIACANVASLFLGRLTTRHKEIAVRQSLGAMRGRIVRQFLIESLTFSCIAGLLGGLLGVWALTGLQSLLSAQLPPNTALTMTWPALALTVAVTLVSAVLVGLAPAVHASRADLVEGLKDSARGSSSSGAGRFRGALIVAEVALSVVLLVGSGLLLTSFLKLQQTSPGFDPRGLASAFVGLPAQAYATPPRQAAFYDDVIAQLRQQPQVTGAAAAVGLPLSGFNPRSPYSVQGRPILPLGQRPLANLAIVSDGYFETLGMTRVSGRFFSPDDRAGAAGVCIINESLARRLFPEESPVGKVLLRGANADVASEIVGVVRDVKAIGLNTPTPDEIYHPMRQLGRASMAIVVRTSGDPANLQNVIRAAVARVDANQPISFFSTMDANISASVGTQRIVASVTAAFAALALLLSAVGLYSVISYTVSQRTAEIGIRMALGARAGQVVALVMRGGLTLVAIGLVLGLAGAAGAARLIQSLLFQVAPLDPMIYGAVALLFGVVAALASLLPSLRASRIDPLLALRPE
ncbi:MAG TPA: ABC transporter permease [Vicinamibacterales bacterium]|nr:ABC transporter permease [Vicinamibacterales bacterium]